MKFGSDLSPFMGVSLKKFISHVSFDLSKTTTLSGKLNLTNLFSNTFVDMCDCDNKENIKSITIIKTPK